jgi:serine protease Do
MKRAIQARWAVALVALALSGFAGAQTHADPPSRDSLQRLNASLEQLPGNVTPALVHIEVTSYGPLPDEDDDLKVQALTKQHGSGSGVIVDSEGYIITALHVVEGARRIRVELNSGAHTETETVQIDDRSPSSSFEAKMVGSFKDADVAVLKINAHDLPTVSFSESGELRQGQLVAALGSPEDLRNSLALGVVSSVARQIEPDDTMVYIQTDVALAPGSSGGPLVDVQGKVVGLNVFSITERGREEGLGFAVPSAMVRFVYQQIREHGAVQRAYLGMDVQGVTPLLARALHLSRGSGVLIAAVGGDNPAARASLQAGDVIVTFDGVPVRNVSQLTWALLHKRPGDLVDLEVWRATGKVVLKLPLVGSSSNSEDSLSTVDIEENLVGKLGIVGSVRRHGTAGQTASESSSGVLVLARLRGNGVQPELVVGDVIHSLNTVRITSIAQLRTVLDKFKPGDAIALQVERKDKLMYVGFELE